MALLVSVLGIAGVAAWITTAAALAQALNGASWTVVFVWGGVAVVLGLLRRAAHRGAVAAERRDVAAEIAGATSGSRRLARALDFIRSPEFTATSRPTESHYRVADKSGSAVMLLSWICVIGGSVLSVIGIFLSLGGTWWVLVLGAVMIVISTPLHNWQKRRYATHVLPLYERGLGEPGTPEPTAGLRSAFWAIAQSAARSSTNIGERIGSTIEVYRILVDAWSQDAALYGSRGNVNDGSR